MSRKDVYVLVDGNECRDNCPFFSRGDCLMFKEPLASHDEWGGVTKYHRCESCKKSFGE